MLYSVLSPYVSRMVRSVAGAAHLTTFSTRGAAVITGTAILARAAFAVVAAVAVAVVTTIAIPTVHITVQVAHVAYLRAKKYFTF